MRRLTVWARMATLLVVMLSLVRMPISAVADEPVKVTDPASYTFKSADATAEISDDAIEFTDASYNEFGRGTEEYLNFTSDMSVGQIGLITNIGSTTRYMNTTKANLEKWYENVEFIDSGKDGDTSWVAATCEDSGDPFDVYFQVVKNGVGDAALFEYVMAPQGELADAIDADQNGITVDRRGFMENVNLKDIDDLFGGTSSESGSTSSTRKATEEPTEESTPESTTNGSSTSGTSRSTSRRSRASETPTEAVTEEATPALAQGGEGDATPSADASSHFPDDSTFEATSQDVTVTWGPEFTPEKSLADANDKLGSYSLTLSMEGSLVFVDVDPLYGNDTPQAWLDIMSSPSVVQVIDKEAKVLDSKIEGQSAALIVDGKSIMGDPELTYHEAMFVDKDTIVTVTIMSSPEELPALIEAVNSSLKINDAPVKTLYTPEDIKALTK